MDISIIIVNYNNCNLLQKCVESVISFTEDITYEIIIVDNNSTECNPEQIIPEINNLILIRNIENHGFAKANNQALKIAQGKYILFLNNDTIFIENTLKKIFNYTEALNKPTIVGCKLLNENGTNQISIGKFDSLIYNISISFFLYKLFPYSKIFNRYYLNYFDFKSPTNVDFVKGAFLLCDKNSVDKLNGFDEGFFFYGEEVDFCYRFRKIGGNIIFYPETKIVHLGGASTDSNLKFKFENQAKGRIQFYQKHFHGVQKYLAIFFHYFGVLIRVPIYFLGGIFTMKRSLIKKSWFYLYQLSVYPRNQFKGKKS